MELLASADPDEPPRHLEDIISPPTRGPPIIDSTGGRIHPSAPPRSQPRHRGPWAVDAGFPCPKCTLTGRFTQIWFERSRGKWRARCNASRSDGSTRLCGRQIYVTDDLKSSTLAANRLYHRRRSRGQHPPPSTSTAPPPTSPTAPPSSLPAATPPSSPITLDHTPPAPPPRIHPFFLPTPSPSSPPLDLTSTTAPLDLAVICSICGRNAAHSSDGCRLCAAEDLACLTSDSE